MQSKEPHSQGSRVGFRVEARGFEPRSETRSTTAPTCVAHRLMSAETGQWAAHSCTSLLKFRPSPRGATTDYPDIPILLTPPRAGFIRSKAYSNSEELRSQGHFSVGSCRFAEGFTRTQHLGTQLQRHRPRRSQVAPGLIMDSRKSSAGRRHVNGTMRDAGSADTAKLLLTNDLRRSSSWYT